MYKIISHHVLLPIMVAILTCKGAMLAQWISHMVPDQVTQFPFITVARKKAPRVRLASRNYSVMEFVLVVALAGSFLSNADQTAQH